MLNHLKSDKQVTHDQLVQAMWSLDIKMESIPAIATIMSYTMRRTPSMKMTVAELVDIFDDAFKALDSELTDDDCAEAIKLLNRIVEL